MIGSPHSDQGSSACTRRQFRRLGRHVLDIRLRSKRHKEEGGPMERNHCRILHRRCACCAWRTKSSSQWCHRLRNPVGCHRRCGYWVSENHGREHTIRHTTFAASTKPGRGEDSCLDGIDCRIWFVFDGLAGVMEQMLHVSHQVVYELFTLGRMYERWHSDHHVDLICTTVSRACTVFVAQPTFCDHTLSAVLLWNHIRNVKKAQAFDLCVIHFWYVKSDVYQASSTE